MTSEVENILNQIGQSVVQAMEEPWGIAWIDVKFEPGVISAQGHYQEPGEAVDQSFGVSGAVSRLFAQLRELVKKDENSRWSSARFTIQSDGTFKIDFDYHSP